MFVSSDPFIYYLQENAEVITVVYGETAAADEAMLHIIVASRHRM